MDACLIEEIEMMAEQLEKAGVLFDYKHNTDDLFDSWHVHLNLGGCFAGTTKETHAYLSGALAVHHRVEYLADKERRET